MKVRCPDCRNKFEIEEHEYDDGDFLNCPECNLELTVVLKTKGKIRLKTTKEKFYDEDEDFEDEEFEEE